MKMYIYHSLRNLITDLGLICQYFNKKYLIKINRNQSAFHHDFYEEKKCFTYRIFHVKGTHSYLSPQG